MAAKLATPSPLILLVCLISARADAQTDTFSVQTTTPTIQTTDIFGTSPPTDCREAMQGDLWAVDTWEDWAETFVIENNRALIRWRDGQMNTSCGRDTAFRDEVQRYYDVARKYFAEGQTLSNRLVQCYRTFIAASCRTQFTCSATPRRPLPNPPTCPGWSTEGSDRPIRGIDVGVRVAPGHTYPLPALVLSLCGTTLKVQLNQDLGLRLKKGMVITLTVPPGTPSRVGTRPVSTAPITTDWSSVTVEFYPETGVVNNIWFRGPGPSGWTRSPCAETTLAGDGAADGLRPPDRVAIEPNDSRTFVEQCLDGIGTAASAAADVLLACQPARAQGQTTASTRLHRGLYTTNAPFQGTEFDMRKRKVAITNLDSGYLLMTTGAGRGGSRAGSSILRWKGRTADGREIYEINEITGTATRVDGKNVYSFRATGKMLGAKKLSPQSEFYDVTYYEKVSDVPNSQHTKIESWALDTRN